MDFIDLGIGDLRFWTFTLADLAITCGAILLAVQLAREGWAPRTDVIFGKD